MRYVRHCFVFIALLTMEEQFLSMPALAKTQETKLTEQCGEFVIKVAQQAIDIINTSGITDEKVKVGFKGLVEANFAVERMVRFVLGRYARQLTPEQSKIFISYFIDMVVRLYASNFNQYKTANVRVTGIKRKTKTIYLVTTRIEIPGKKSTAVVWSVSSKEEKFLISDATMDEVSFLQILQAMVQNMLKGGIDNFMQTLKNQGENGNL